MHNEIHVIGLEFVGPHGVEEHERLEGRTFKVDVIATVGPLRGFTSDRLADTVDYEKIAACIMSVGTESSCHLVEHLAERMAAGCLQLPAVLSVDLTVHKRATGVPGDPAWVGVRVIRER